MTDCVDNGADAAPMPSAPSLDRRIRTLRRLTQWLVLSTILIVFLDFWPIVFPGTYGESPVMSIWGYYVLRGLSLGHMLLFTVVSPLLGVITLTAAFRTLRSIRGFPEYHPTKGTNVSRFEAISSLAILVPTCPAVLYAAHLFVLSPEEASYIVITLPSLILSGVLALVLGFLAWRPPRRCRPQAGSSWLGGVSVSLSSVWAATLIGSVSYLWLVARGSPYSGLPGLSKADMASPAQVREVVQGDTAFAFDLYQQLRQADGNLFFSPYSLSTALAMVYAGAKDATRQQMAQVLHFPLDQERLHPAFAQLRAGLDDLRRDGDITMGVANSLWVQEEYPLLREYLTLVRLYYGVSITPLDYRDRQRACERVNEWVEQKTNGKIKDVLEPSVLNELTRLILVNAIYFKGSWQTSFNTRFTEDLPFHVTTSRSVNAPTMTGTLKARYNQTKSLQILELSYVGGATSMLVLLPDEIDGLSDLEASLSPANLTKWGSGMRETKVAVFLPKFTMTSQHELDQTLQAMGMIDVFKLLQANLAGMTGKPDLHISAVIQKAYVEVNEKGTEATAATTVTTKTLSRGFRSPKEPPTFRADHPFLFLISENHTGSILFMGRVTDPTKPSH